jgi:WD40 repeat protein
MKYLNVVLVMLFFNTIFAQNLLQDLPNTHTGNINTVAIHPFKTEALTGGSDSRTNLVDILSGKKIKAFSGHSTAITSIDINHDGRWMATGSDDGTIVILDYLTQKPHKILKVSASKVATLQFSKTQFLASGLADGSLIVWNISNGQKLSVVPANTDKSAIVNVKFYAIKCMCCLLTKIVFLRCCNRYTRKNSCYRCHCYGYLRRCRFLSLCY